MKKGISFLQINIYSIIMTGILLFGGTILYGQEADSFYVNLLQKGEKSFLAKNYKDAVKELEIAVFGRLAETRLKARAYIYLSLSYYYLINFEKSEKHIKDVESLIDKEEFKNLGMSESVLSEFQRLMNFFMRGEIQGKKNEGLPHENGNPQDKEKEEKKVIEDLIKELEMKIRADPDNSLLYYELFRLYRKSENLKGDKRIIKNLIKKNPAEVIAYFLLGITYYNEQNYRKAAKNFLKIFDLTKDMRMDLDLLGEAGAYMMLSTHLRGDTKGALTIAAGLMNYMPEEKISSPSLSQKDKAILQDIIEIYKRKSETEWDS
ncbi:MAG: hypothetical protein GTN73_00150 [Candidatus Aminicenantes bacterium]|nr:hypothetical protein [Candidatus Aminicenantes bacterium]